MCRPGAGRVAHRVQRGVQTGAGGCGPLAGVEDNSRIAATLHCVLKPVQAPSRLIGGALEFQRVAYLSGRAVAVEAAVRFLNGFQGVEAVFGAVAGDQRPSFAFRRGIPQRREQPRGIAELGEARTVDPHRVGARSGVLEARPGVKPIDGRPAELRASPQALVTGGGKGDVSPQKQRLSPRALCRCGDVVKAIDDDIGRHVKSSSASAASSAARRRLSARRRSSSSTSASTSAPAGACT